MQTPHLGPSYCEPGFANSDLANDVDLTDYLCNPAAYTAMLNKDSPMGHADNYYLALNSGRWSIVQWHHNNIMPGAAGLLCNPVACATESLVDRDVPWPTCRSCEQNQKEICPEDCQYERCYREGFTIPGMCDPDSSCVHETTDEKCKGILDGVDPRRDE